jgi:hypothetical protein
MSQEPEDDDLEPEYDFSGAVRGKYCQHQQGTNVVLLDADVAQAFKDSESVNGLSVSSSISPSRKFLRAVDPRAPESSEAIKLSS